jgi:hypothetical protein
MFERSQYAEWRNMDITQELLKSISEAATGAATEILTRESANYDRDQYLKGQLAAFSSVSGWVPIINKEDGEKAMDDLNDES